MTSDARGDWHIRSQTQQRAGPRDVDMTGSTFHHMLAFAAFMTEHCRNTFWRRLCDEGYGEFVTTIAIIAGGFLILPVAIEARVVTVRHRLECSDRWFKDIRRAW